MHPGSGDLTSSSTKDELLLFDRVAGGLRCA